MRTRSWKTIGFWTVTVLFASLMLFSGGLYLSGAAEVREGLARLGYPPYLTTILGIAKLLGALALLQSRWPTLREWAYAGFTINLVGATASHVLADDGLGQAMVPAMFLVPLAISYVLRPDETRIPTVSRRSAVVV